MREIVLFIRLLALAIGAMCVSPVLAGDAAPVPDEISRLRAENDALRSTVQRLAKENTALTLEVKRLLAILGKAGIETFVAQAIVRYRSDLKNVATGDGTDIQKRLLWLEACRQLGEALRKNKITIEYVVTNVRFKQELISYPGKEYTQGLAYISVGPGVIRSADPSVPDASIEPPSGGLRVPMSQEDALGVKAESLLKVSGCCALNVRFDVPIESQPALYSIDSALVVRAGSKTGMERKGPRMQGYQLLGKFTEDPYRGYSPCLVVQDDCIVEVNGVRRGLYIAPLAPEQPPVIIRPRN
ncbi:MAG: hypothetical protein NTX87_18850 [Planctomycetota bacterium]|nr:hypothetical protein [Planctomycetota bacterium]